MSEIQRQSDGRSKTLFMTGIPCFLFGLFMLAQCRAFAAFFLGAQFLFGIPLTGGDAFKVLMIELASAITILMGIVIIAVGAALFLKSSNARSASAPGPTAAR